MPIPQELFFLVGWASCPSHQLMKRTFARGLLLEARTEINCIANDGGIDAKVTAYCS